MFNCSKFHFTRKTSLLSYPESFNVCGRHSLLAPITDFFSTSLSCDRRNLSVYSSVKHCKHLASPAPSLTSHKEKVESSVNKEFINHGRILLQITRNKTFQLFYAS